MATTTTQQTQSTKPTPVSRMRLDALVKGRQVKPTRTLLYGVEGVGKSTFGAKAPSPIFIGAEDGTAHLDVTRFPMPATWSEVLDAVKTLTADPHDFRTLTKEDHSFQTLVVDTLDWLEPLLWAHICERDGVPNIEAYGFAKGYIAALDEWRIFLAALERLRDQRGMHVILLAHSWIKPFKNPEGNDFDRYELKLHAKAGGLLKEWSDVVLFANYETFAEKDKATRRVKGMSTGQRIIYTTRTAAYDAKNRYDLPEQMALDWDEYWTAVQAHRPADPKALEAAIRTNAEHLDGPLKAKVLEAITRAGGDAVKLAQLNTYTNTKVAEAAQ